MLHGHSHGNLSDCGRKTLDMGVDVPENKYTPVSFDMVMERMSTRGIFADDHHGPSLSRWSKFCYWLASFG